MNPFFYNSVTRWFLNRLAHAQRLAATDHHRMTLEKVALFDELVIFGPNSRIRNNLNDKDRIKIRSPATIEGELLIYGHGGRIEIGSYTYIGENSRIWSASLIKLGNNVLVSHGVNIHDNDSHSIDFDMRRKHFKHILETSSLPNTSFDTKESPIIIEDDVWIGFNASILKGVRIGRGAIVAACAVVTKDVEPFTFVAGNPAVLKRRLEPNK